MNRSSLPAGGVFALLVCTILACDDHDEFRKDVALCEEAVARLEACCPHGAPAIRCHYLYEPNSVPPSDDEEHDCGGPGCGCNSDRLVVPDLDEDASTCILQRSCDALAAACEGAREKSEVCR